METDERIGTSRPLALRKIETPRQLLIKKEIAGHTVTAKKRDCETREIQQKFLRYPWFSKDHSPPLILRYQPTHRGRLRADRSSALCFNKNPYKPYIF